MSGFEVDGNSLAAQFSGGHRSDRSNDDSAERANQVGGIICFVGNLNKVAYLHGGGHEQNIDLAADYRLHGLSERRGVFGQAPLVDADGHHLSTALGESGEQFGRWRAVFLNRDAAASKRDVTYFFVEKLEEFAPGIRFGNSRRDGDTELAQCGNGLRSAGDNCRAAECVHKFLAGANRSRGLRERSRSHAGQKDYDVDAAFPQSGDKFQRVALIFDGNFAGGGSDEPLGLRY